MLEESLRETLAARVETPPVADDLATRVIRRGQAIRRRRAVASLLSVSAALILVVGTVMALGGGWPGGPPSGSTSVAGWDADDVDPEATTAPVPVSDIDPGIGLDIRSGDQLWTADGRRLNLGGVGQVTRIYRVPVGWVYAGIDRVRLLRTDGSSVALSGKDGRWVLSADGSRFAFQLGTTLYVAVITATGMAVLGDVPVPADSWPVALTADRVVVSVPERGYGMIDLAAPALPTLNADVTVIYGVRGDRLVGLVRGDRADCLADLVGTGRRLTPAHTGACDFRSGQPASRTEFTSAAGGLAPDGRWLAAWRGATVTVVDVERTLTGSTAAVECPGEATVTPIWADSRTVVTGDARNVVRCAVDGTSQVLPLPEGVGEDWQLVPRLLADPEGR